MVNDRRRMRAQDAVGGQPLLGVDVRQIPRSPFRNPLTRGPEKNEAFSFRGSPLLYIGRDLSSHCLLWWSQHFIAENPSDREIFVRRRRFLLLLGA